MTPLRLLIVDDSAYNRALLSSLFDKSTDVTVVGRAADGEEALRLAASTAPDVITLDLEMPKMDGFTFLRLQLARKPVPVVVVSSYAQRENVFRALELGAYDFVAKTASQIGEAERELQRTILEKVRSVRGLDPGFLAKLRARVPPAAESRSSLPTQGQPAPNEAAAERVIGVAASTGGPAALTHLVSALPASSRAALLITQHMPEKFTRTFAERLSKKSTWTFTEAMGGMPVTAGAGFIAPGAKCMELTRALRGLTTTVVAPTSTDRFVPSADRLFSSLAAVFAERAVGVVLTGMGDDGVAGARAIRDRGGVVWVEADESAVASQMPRAIRDAGLASEVLSLDALRERFADLTR